MKGLLAAALMGFCAVPAVAAGPAAWPHGAKAAVVLSYDDALTSQLDHAVPVLDKAGLKATFFLSNVKRAEVDRWRAAAREGHELANHTVFHACPAATYPADPRNTTEAYTPATMLIEIEQENVLLTAIDGKAEHGFGTPCGNGKAGGKDYLAALIAGGTISYLRTGTATADDARIGPGAIDPMNVPARSFPDTVTGAQLIDYAREAEAGGGLALYVFHGVAGNYLQVSDPAHKELVAWLAAHRKDVWVATMGEVMDWVRTHRDAGAPQPR